MSFQTLAIPTSVSDYDGNIYDVILIGNQIWMGENLKTTHYSDGTAITNVTDNTGWITAGAAYCWYENNYDTYGSVYGALYNWKAVDPASNGNKNLCPIGWHVPTDTEWTTLTTFITNDGHSGTEGTALKSTTGWSSGGNGTDNYGFAALPGGFRGYGDGTFYDVGFGGYF